MRDIVLTLIIVGLLPFCFVKPWIGALVWAWLGYMNPHHLTWGFAYRVPWAQMVAIATLAGVLFTRDRRPLPKVAEMYLLWALFAIFTLSPLVIAVYPEDAWVLFDPIWKTLLMVFVSLLLLQDPQRFRALVLVIALSIGFFGLKGGVWAVLTGGQFRVMGPPESTIGDNNAISLALNMMLPFYFFLRQAEERKWMRGLWLAIFVFSIISVLSSYSRGAILGLGVVLMLLVFRNKRIIAGTLLLALGVGVALTALPDKWFGRMETIQTYEQDKSANLRLQSWTLAWRIALDKPILGGGFAIFDKRTYSEYVPEFPATGNVAHNNFLQILAEHGFLGLGVYVALIVVCMVSLRRLSNRARSDPSIAWVGRYAVMIEVGMVGYVVTGLFVSKSYFDLFYSFVAMTILLKQLVLDHERRVRRVSPGWRVRYDSGKGGPLPASEKPVAVT